MISSPSAQIVNAIAESHFVRSSHGEDAPAYGPTMGVATAIIALGIAFTVAIGPEKLGRQFELAKVAGIVDSSSESESEDVEKHARQESPHGRTSDVDEKK